MFSIEILYIFIFVLIVCLLGFKKYIWFISLGYGFSISSIGFMLLFLFHDNLNFSYILGSLILIIYGLRLGIFLALRESKNSSYNKKMKNEIKNDKNIKLSLKIVMWLSCALLYIIMSSPIIYCFINQNNINIIYYVGLTISLLGIIFESISDYQKSKFKKSNPNKFVNYGLFRIVRCPNYLGELIVWIGIFIAGITNLSFGQLIIAIIGLLGIIYIMFSGARRLELRQDRTYGNIIEYQKYIKKTPILLPLIPLYSVKKYKWLVA